MGWILGCHSPREPALLEHFFSVLGKALYVANAYESKCRHVLQIARLVQLYNETGDGYAAFELAKVMKDKMLAGTLSEIQTCLTVTSSEVALLDKAKDARNFIAHEGGRIGFMPDARSRCICDQLDALRVQVKALAAGDNVVSRWEYEIQEKEPAPIGMCEFYPAAVEEWVFGGPASFDTGRMVYERREATRLASQVQ